jgi:hypothetical protein
MKKQLAALWMIFWIFSGTAFAGGFTDPIGAVWSDLSNSGITKRVASSDTSQTLISNLTLVSGHYPIGALITCETYDVRIAFGADAVLTGGSEVGHVLTAGSSIWLYSNSAVRNARFINKTSGSNGVLQITYFY